MRKRKKKLYVIPGFGESTRMKNYREVIRYARENHFNVVTIKVEWDLRKVMTDYVSEVAEQIPDQNEGDVLLGFSFGAYIAYVISQKKFFSDYIFCTISPYFKENLKDIPQESKDYFGKKFMDSLKKYTAHDGVNTNATFLIGEKDWGLAIEYNQVIKESWKGEGVFKKIKLAGHELGHPNYSQAVINVLKKLRV